MRIQTTGCGILIMTLIVLATVSPGHGANGCPDASLTQLSSNEVYGYLQHDHLGFLLQSGWDIQPGPPVNGETYGKRMTKVEFYLGDKTLMVQAGGGNLYIKGFTTNTGALTRLTSAEKQLLKDTLENHGCLSLGEATEFFFNSLDALSSWPADMLVFIWNDSESAMSAVGQDRLAIMSRKDFNARNADAVKLALLDQQTVQNLSPPTLDMTATDVRELESVRSVTSICFALGHKYTGRYFECDDIFCIDRTNHRYSHYVGGPSCFGRCGAGCTGIPHGRKYTRDCFNHDSCVKNLGTFDFACDIMFTFCADDIISAPRCPN